MNAQPSPPAPPIARIAHSRDDAPGAVEVREVRKRPRRWRRRSQDLSSDRVRNAPLLQLLDGADLDEVRRHFSQLDLGPGRPLLVEGRLGRQFMLLLDGHVQVERRGQAVAELAGGDFVGEVALLPGITGSDGHRNASVVSLSKVTLGLCTGADLRYLMELSPAVRSEVESRALAHT